MKQLNITAIIFGCVFFVFAATGSLDLSSDISNAKTSQIDYNGAVALLKMFG